MRILLIGVLVFPGLLSAQQSPSVEYRDGFTAPGETEGASAISLGKKWQIYTSRIYSPRALLFTAVTAGIRQAENSPGQWGRGIDGYGKRYGTNLGRTAIKNTLAASIDSVAHLDPRFYRAPDGTKGVGRLTHALAQVIIIHKDGGGRSFAYGNVLGTFAAGEAGSLWQPRRSDGRFGDGLVYSGLSFAADAGRNVFREFWPDIHKKFKH